jgi:hypothetical protein
MNLHSALAENLLPNPTDEGRIRQHAVDIALFRANLCPLTFLDVPEAAYSHATLGVYELTRVELLRDLYVWAYERSTQEYQAIQQDLAEPDPLRLAYRNLIKQTVLEVVQQAQADPLHVIERALKSVPLADRTDVHALLVQELQRLHEGVLARYGLRPSELMTWRAAQGSL